MFQVSRMPSGQGSGGHLLQGAFGQQLRGSQHLPLSRSGGLLAHGLQSLGEVFHQELRQPPWEGDIDLPVPGQTSHFDFTSGPANLWGHPGKVIAL